MEMPNESSSLFNLLGIEVEEVDYGSDVEFKASTSLRDDMSRQVLNPFPEHRAADTLTVLQ